MIKELTALRGVFILFIFFHHCLEIYPGGGSMAVTFFFVLGGFSMTLGYKERLMRSNFSYRQYIIRRCIKFYPLHWLCLIAVLPLVPFVFDWKHLVVLFSNVTLMHTLIPVRDFYFSYNSVSWYLADTIFFAILFPFILRWILKTSTIIKTIAIILFVVLYVLVAVRIPQTLYHSVLYISPYMRLYDFVLGIILALVYLKIKNDLSNLKWRNANIILTVAILVLISALVLESCYLDEYLRLIAPVYWPIIVTVIFATTTLNSVSGGGNLLQNKVLLKLGELVFTIFLTHHLILRYITKLFDYYKLYNNVIYVALTLILTIAVSYILEQYILKYITEWISKKIPASMSAQS